MQRLLIGLMSSVCQPCFSKITQLCLDHVCLVLKSPGAQMHVLFGHLIFMILARLVHRSLNNAATMKYLILMVAIVVIMFSRGSTP